MIDVAVQKRLGDFTLDAQFAAPDGITAIFGRSGSGKTSLINVVAGLLQPDAGHVRIDGTDLTQVPVRRRRIGYVFQDARLFPHLSVAQNLAYGGTHDREAVIDMLGLGALLDRRPAKLSGGETSRVALGRALMSNPQLLLMDEPLAALDTPRKAEVMGYLERLRDRSQVPILYVSHDMSEVARLSRTLVIMDAGRVVRAGPVAEVLSDPQAVPLVGVRDAGAVLTGRVQAFDADDELTQVALSSATLTLPGRLGPVGAQVRLRVPAQDVILSTQAPIDISALNVLPCRIATLIEGQGPGVAVSLTCGTDRLLARITRRSARAMGLRVGQEVHAILKATAIAAADVGTGDAP
ncbi:molybdenum ABC transporter ATP-binding protein [Loktanella sp. 3ANDIMAR09]|uniref:molybdenum ABC transporter ATP-binding protein n=1 Tax=Loktanella sp. 3ANDIMAR09 TaxID=1225657 RepID=UPI0006FE7136|nr:molybdenum ABC transporter ATP-binding protein [Loktanella sp. 3ANDIMAR09]KQI69260.1 molybdenum ABC transporter ATP-binding protein [Loktanella sp. 3ANDIMAR09]